jgi:RNA polymerase sigma factor (sigma-70 family)
MTNLQTIIRGCINNDSKCQQVLYHKYYTYAFRIAFRYIYQYKCIADIVNAGFVKLFTSSTAFLRIDKNNIELSLSELIKRTIINTAIIELRRYKFMPETGSNPEEIWEEPVNGNDAVKITIYKELICYVKSLSPIYRIVYNMYEIDGFSHEEIADQLGISVDNSKSNLYRAKSSLEKLIRKEIVCSNL